LIIIVLSVVNWPDRLTGRKEKETDPKVFARGFSQGMIMTVNCRFLKPRDKGCFTVMVFSGYITVPKTCHHRLPPSHALIFLAQSIGLL
jgi:predicted esterase